LSEPVSILLKGEGEKLLRSSTHFFRASGVILRDNDMVFNLSLAFEGWIWEHGMEWGVHGL
jgi:hypothetical protein